jgi:hypothetical protein
LFFIQPELNVQILLSGMQKNVNPDRGSPAPRHGKINWGRGGRKGFVQPRKDGWALFPVSW